MALRGFIGVVFAIAVVACSWTSVVDEGEDLEVPDQDSPSPNPPSSDDPDAEPAEDPVPEPESSSDPDPVPLTGAFLQLHDGYSSWTQETFDASLAALAAISADTLIVQRSVNEDVAYFPTSMVPTSYNLLDPILNAADTMGLKVYLGLYQDDLWWDADVATLDTLAQTSNDVADALFAAYGGRESFYGFYVPFELDNLNWTSAASTVAVTDFFGTIYDHLKGLDAEAPVMMSPFFSEVSGTLDPSAYAQWWQGLIDPGSPPIADIVAFQDGAGRDDGMSSESIENFLQNLASVFAAAPSGPALWINVESFSDVDAGDNFCGVPTTVDRLMQQIERCQGLTEKIVTFEWVHYLDPGNDGLYDFVTCWQDLLGVDELSDSGQALLPSELYEGYREAYGL